MLRKFIHVNDGNIHIVYGCAPSSAIVITVDRVAIRTPKYGCPKETPYVTGEFCDALFIALNGIVFRLRISLRLLFYGFIRAAGTRHYLRF